MTYELITNRDSRNFTPAASVAATFGRTRTIDSITIHWWGLPEWGDTFDGVCNFLCTNTKPTSAHEVIEAGRVAVLVNHGDASWAAGNAVGNATSIHLECRPRASEEDYATVAERVRDLRAMYGDLPLIPHRDWQATQCPGHWDLNKIDRLARSMTGGASILPTGTTTSEEEDDMATPAEIWAYEIAAPSNPKMKYPAHTWVSEANEKAGRAEAKAEAAIAAVKGLLEVRVPDPDNPERTYALKEWITRANIKAGAAAEAAGAIASGLKEDPK